MSAEANQDANNNHGRDDEIAAAPQRLPRPTIVVGEYDQGTNRYTLTLHPPTHDSHIAADLNKLVKKLNPAYTHGANQEQFSALYAQGPVLFQVQAIDPRDGSSSTYLGGIYVSPRMREPTISALKARGYEIYPPQQ